MAPKIYIVEHLDPELGPWSSLEYACIATESHASGSRFILSSVLQSLASNLPPYLEALRQKGILEVETRSVEEVFGSTEEGKARVCLLDPKAGEELSVGDGGEEGFDVFLFGGILGDDPPRDRTAELRVKGFPGRRLGPLQMTTDTAVRVTRTVIQNGTPMDEIPYVDNPDMKVNEHESVEMPFRYVRDGEGRPILPEGMFELIKRDSEKGLDDML